jgi:beta-xylosidase
MPQATNPIIPGFAPDPSIVKAGEWYFLVTSSFHMFPGLPIYVSNDLGSWKHIGELLAS